MLEPDSAVVTRIFPPFGSTLMLVRVPFTGTEDDETTLFFAPSISVTFFCDASSTSTVFVFELSASAVGLPPTSIFALSSLVVASRASTAAFAASST